MTDEAKITATSIEENGGDTLESDQGSEGGRTRGKRGRGDRSGGRGKREVVVKEEKER